MRRETANVLLILLGGVLVRIALDGTALRYVRPSLLPWLVVAGSVVIVLAVVAVVRDLRGVHRAVEGQAGAHGHGSRSAWLLALPVLALVLVTPPALGVASVSLADGRTVEPARPEGAALPGRPVLGVRELVQRAVWDRTGSLDGVPVTVTGFVVNGPGGEIDLARMVITCCAADAYAVRLRLAGAVPAADPGSWWTVTGTIVRGTATPESNFVPTLTVTSAATAPVPAEQYEY